MNKQQQQQFNYSKDKLREKNKLYKIHIDIKEAQKVLHEFAELICKNFVIDSNNKESFNQMFFWFTRNQKHFKGDLRKGLLTVGHVGSGKSIAFKIFQEFVKLYNLHEFPYNLGYQIVKTMKIKSEFENSKTGGEIALSKYKRGIWVFDDLGKEIKDLQQAFHFGSKINVMENILDSQYEHFQNSGKIIHATSNYPLLTSNSIRPYEKFYGKYIDDRLIQMFNVIYFKGKSRRK